VLGIALTGHVSITQQMCVILPNPELHMHMLYNRLFTCYKCVIIHVVSPTHPGTRCSLPHAQARA
jgi:hypothetical protein